MIDMRVPALPDDTDTVLLLAGDTGSYKRKLVYAAAINLLCDRFAHVYDIPGNHYWYGGTPLDVCDQPVVRDNYTFGETFVAGNLVAATLWADFRRGDPLVEMACIQGMNDFRQIAGLTTDMVKERHSKHVEFLRANVRPGCVVMTHFLPSWRSVPAEFTHDVCSGYYASALDDLVEEVQPAIWLHGHTHTACSYEIGPTRVICNPAGYEGRDHNPVLVVDVPPTS